MRLSYSFQCTLLKLGLVFSLLGCTQRSVVIEGKRMPKSNAAQVIFEQANTAREKGNTILACKKYEEITTRFPKADVAPDALLALGNLYKTCGKDEKARKAFKRLVHKYPHTKHYTYAARSLSLLLARVGDLQQALYTLETIFSRLPTMAEKFDVARELAPLYEQANSAMLAIRCYVVILRGEKDKATKQVLQKQAKQTIARLNINEVREILAFFNKVGERGFPVDILMFTLGDSYYHANDFAQAEKALEKFVSTYPRCDLVGQANYLLKSIRESKKVDPTSVGVLLPLTGEYRIYGKQALESIQLGFGIFERAKSKSLSVLPSLVVRDTAGNPEQAARELENLVFNEHVVAIVGPMFSREAYGAARKAQQLHVPIICLSGREQVAALGSYVFCNFLTLKAQAETLVHYATEELNISKFALLYPHDDYGMEFANAFKDQVKNKKGEICATECYEPDTKNFSPYIRKMVGRYLLHERKDYNEERKKIYEQYKKPLLRKRAMEKLTKSLPPIIDFQAIFVPDYVDNIVLIAPAIAYEDVILHTENEWEIERIKKSLNTDDLDMVYLLGGNGWNNPKIIEWAGRYVQGAIFVDGFFVQSDRPCIQRFVHDFEANFARIPDMVDAHAFDTAKIVRTIIEDVGPTTRDEFLHALSTLENFAGVTGKTSFKENGQAEKELFLLTIHDDEIVEKDRSQKTLDNASISAFGG